MLKYPRAKSWRFKLHQAASEAPGYVRAAHRCDSWAANMANKLEDTKKS
jgi:hypothetical protein